MIDKCSHGSTFTDSGSEINGPRIFGNFVAQVIQCQDTNVLLACIWLHIEADGMVRASRLSLHDKEDSIMVGNVGCLHSANGTTTDDHSRYFIPCIDASTIVDNRGVLR